MNLELPDVLLIAAMIAGYDIAAWILRKLRARLNQARAYNKNFDRRSKG